jgi:hypothetical protein
MPATEGDLMSSTPRLRLERPAPPPTLLDGGWWPRSTDPLTELPGLIRALEERRGRVARIMLCAGGWDDHPRRVDALSGHVVRLGWFRTLPEGLLTAILSDGGRVDLLVIPPATDRPAAHAAMDLAAQPGNRLRTPEILAAMAAPGDTTPDEIWISEGGSLAA